MLPQGEAHQPPLSFWYISMAPNTYIATRSLIVTLNQPISDKDSKEIAGITGFPRSNIDTIYSRVIETWIRTKPVSSSN